MRVWNAVHGLGLMDGAHGLGIVDGAHGLGLIDGAHGLGIMDGDDDRGSMRARTGLRRARAGCDSPPGHQCRARGPRGSDAAGRGPGWPPSHHFLHDSTEKLASKLGVAVLQVSAKPGHWRGQAKTGQRAWHESPLQASHFECAPNALQYSG